MDGHTCSKVEKWLAIFALATEWSTQQLLKQKLTEEEDDEEEEEEKREKGS